MSNVGVQNNDGSWIYSSDTCLPLEKGGELCGIDLVYETWGSLNADKSNAILVHHALSVGAHVAESERNPEKGWWNDMVGPGKAIDSDKYFVICINNLGSCFGSTGPTSINPETSKPYNATFPEITIGDMVNSQKRLIDALGIKTLYAIVGNSMGAMLSLIWAIEYPENVDRVMLSCSSYKAYPANIANRNIQQSAIRLDPAWNQGDYESNEQLEGFKLARKLGLYTYRNSAEWNRRFNSHDDKDTEDGEITRYMDYNAEKFVKIFDANSYLAITTAMDSYDVTQNYTSNKEAFSKIKANVVVVSEQYDILFTPQQQEELFMALQEADVNCHFISHHSQFGHDAFLVETNRFGGYIREFLQDLHFEEFKIHSL
ncbi:homoserine O-acetyltransferase [Aliikangiella sp. G2MR2-5]|uniref:homoserine O-acetyltransferase MetX n=1 Tax=Aliikangiella sp. G2MR2-5 TaxID=2788943 RepID=UPI0018AB6CDE|nr:homoserine O-acetyltransferase [Aliikangiella sp. G2MR2-5]